MTAFEWYDKQDKTLDNYLVYLQSFIEELNYEDELLKEFVHLLGQKSVTAYLSIPLEYEIVKLENRFKLNILSPKPYTTFEV